MTRPGPVLLTGMFDMENYGDLLFPQIAQWRLAALGHDMIAVAPTGHATGLADAMPAMSIADMMSGTGPITGVVVGGGYIIHAHSMDFLEDYQTHGTGTWCGAGLWLGATVAAAIRDVPIAWNAPGVPHPFSMRQRSLVHAALAAASYAAVRDRGSAALLAAPARSPCGGGARFDCRDRASLAAQVTGGPLQAFAGTQEDPDGRPPSGGSRAQPFDGRAGTNRTRGRDQRVCTGPWPGADAGRGRAQP